MIVEMFVGMVLLSPPTPREMPKPPPEDRLPLSATKVSDFAYEELERMHKFLKNNYTLVPTPRYKK